MGITLASMTKVAIAGTLAGGVLVAGITWQGDGKVSNIKGNLDNMKNEIVQAVEDNEFLQGQFANLKGLYTSSVDEANATIEALKQNKTELESQKAGLETRIASLESDLEIAEDKTAERDELQGEINRLENELDKANQAIAELETYAQAIDDETQYNAIDRTAYAVEELEVMDVESPTTETPTPTPSEEPIEAPSLEDDTTELTPAQAIEKELRTADNYNNLTAYGVDLIDQTNNDWFFVEVVQTGVDYQGKPRVALNYTVKNDAKNLVATNFLSSTGLTLQEYLGKQSSTMATKHNVIVDATNFNRENGTLKAFRNTQDGSIKNR